MQAEEQEKAKNPEFLYQLAKKYYAHSLWDEADRNYAAAVGLDPDNKTGDADDAQLGRASAEGKMEDFAKAVAHCRELIKRWPQSDLVPDATTYIGWYATQGGMIDQAKAAYVEYLKRWPTGDDAQFAKDELEKLNNPPKKN